MRHPLPRIALVCAVSALPAVGLTQTPPGDKVAARAKQLHDRAIVVDTHDDTTQRLIWDTAFNLAVRNTDGHIDVPRMREGGLDAVFFSIWMPGSVSGPVAVKRALGQIDAVREVVHTHPADFILATTAAEIRLAAAQRKIAALMGVEGGHMIDNDLAILRVYAALGVRYLTLTHSLNTTWADSSGDKPVHDGLTMFGKDVVRELNRLGVMVDISHVSDKTFFDAVEVSKAPVIASHSSARAISKSPRNMTDDMLRAIAKNGGVVMINYHTPFLSDEFRVASESATHQARLKPLLTKCGDNEACRLLTAESLVRESMAGGQLPKVSWETIIDHIDHVVKIAGVDHVGLGSDFDGATMPLGLEDVSKLPRITEALLRKGYTEQNIEKILGGNILRVMEHVERVAKAGVVTIR